MEITGLESGLRLISTGSVYHLPRFSSNRYSNSWIIPRSRFPNRIKISGAGHNLLNIGPIVGTI